MKTVTLQVEPNMDAETLHENYLNKHKEIARLIQEGSWTPLVEYLKEFHWRINCTEHVKKDDREKGILPNLNTPLHYAVLKGAPSEILTQLIEIGSLLTLKNAEGDTPHAIAVKKEAKEEVLKILEPPQLVLENQTAIEQMEASLHKVINGRVEKLLEENHMTLPQLAPFWEKAVEEVQEVKYYYEVPGFYGGFHLSFFPAERFLMADSFCRIWGGSEERHIIKSNGKIKERHSEVQMYPTRRKCEII